MANQIIVRIRDDTPDDKAAACVLAVIKKGRISDNGNSYCYIAEFSDGTIVATHRAKTADVFEVWKGREVDVED